MRILGLIAAASALLGACGTRDDGRAPDPGNQARSAAPAEAPVEAPTAPVRAATLRWDLQSNREGVALALLPASGPAAIRIFCPAGGARLVVNVPGFRPIASEERLSFGGGGEVVALVADTAGDRQRGGVSGGGDVPEGLSALIAGAVSASYGAQRSGPHPAPPHALSTAFAAACRKGAAPPAPPTAAPAVANRTVRGSPCLVQDGRTLTVAPVRAVGTEPFWGARVEGRCVTYSNPEDQKGTRIWTRFTPGPGGGTWAGSLGDRRFELRIRLKRGCSDGMSDRVYPMAAELVVAGERRSGCAEPL